MSNLIFQTFDDYFVGSEAATNGLTFYIKIHMDVTGFGFYHKGFSMNKILKGSPFFIRIINGTGATKNLSYKPKFVFIGVRFKTWLGGIMRAYTAPYPSWDLRWRDTLLLVVKFLRLS